jgi:dTDP-L-rhamnose 4-epimerase
VAQIWPKVRAGETVSLFRSHNPAYPDGGQLRDFVYVDDVVDATAACIAPDVTGVHAFNVGSGVRTSVIDVARSVVQYFSASVPVRVSGNYRLGDIRHNFADIAAIQAATSFTPRWAFQEGLREFLRWSEDFKPADAGFEKSLAELRERGLLGSAKA